MREFKIFYENAKDYRLLPATGVYGGISPNGEIIIEFFVEKQESPEYVTMEVDDSGSAKQKEKGSQRYIREKQVGLVLRPDIALNIGNFIVERARSIIKPEGKDHGKVS